MKREPERDFEEKLEREKESETCLIKHGKENEPEGEKKKTVSSEEFIKR